MEIDKTTLLDLSVFNPEEEFSVFHKINCTITSNGEAQLRINLSAPLQNIESIQDVQQTIRVILAQSGHWPGEISNGTIKVIERFYETGIDPLPSTITPVNAYSYKLLHGPDFSLVKYSVIHCFDFIKGMKKIRELLLPDCRQGSLKKILDEINQMTAREEFHVLEKNNKAAEISLTETLQLGHFLRFRFKHQMIQLLHIHAQIDAWYAMALAMKKYGLVFPTFTESAQPFIETKSLYHILLHNPVAYDVSLNRQTNFLFLTGANMAGKSTFIKSVGIAVFLAHAGMGVTAKSMELSFFDGMLSNINIMDNIAKGESYFFNEVQRIKATISKVNDGRKWLILIYELFKGTNVQDAMKCSTLVIEGFLKIKNAIFILSTHLYEIGDGLKVHPNIHFNYFETAVINDQLIFNYQLKEGISNDRFGYLILKKEGVVKMLEDL